MHCSEEMESPQSWDTIKVLNEVKEFKRLKMLLLSSRDVQLNLQCHCKVVDYWTDRKLTCNFIDLSISFNFDDFLLSFVVLNWIFLGLRLKIFKDITVDIEILIAGWIILFFLSIVLKETDTQIQEIHLPPYTTTLENRNVLLFEHGKDNS